MADGSTATSAKEIQSSTVSSVILEPIDRDCLGNMIVEPMDKVVLDSNLMDKVVLDSTSPGNTPTPTGCASPRPMMEVVICSHICSISTIFILLQSMQNGHIYRVSQKNALSESSSCKLTPPRDQIQDVFRQDHPLRFRILPFCFAG